jgi:hypothetical protein
MKDWIEKNINPPGLKKKNRGALFSAIGRVFGIVRTDALIAFNAHFPYLCDLQTLKRHGISLKIPEFDQDTEDEYRARVATASFYLMRAGERGYCHEQLSQHFGDRYVLSEEFLKVYVKIMDLEDKDRAWVKSFLDGMLNPNILLNVAEWFQIVENIPSDDPDHKIKMTRNETEYFKTPIKYNGAIKYDGHTANDRIVAAGKYDGTFKYNGDLSYCGIGRLRNEHKPIPPFKYGSGIVDVFTANYKTGFVEDTYRARQCFDGSIQYSGVAKYNGVSPYSINEAKMFMAMCFSFTESVVMADSVGIATETVSAGETDIAEMNDSVDISVMRH